MPIAFWNKKDNINKATKTSKYTDSRFGTTT